VNNVPTVSDTKRNFYARHTRPINSVYRRVVEELLVEMHLLSVNVDFRTDPIYYLGVVTSFDRFMDGYSPERDKESIFAALCGSVGGDAGEYRKVAEELTTFAKSKGKELITMLCTPTPETGGESLLASLEAIANNTRFKYSRLFAIGLCTLLEEADPELVQEEEGWNNALKQLSEALHLPLEKLQKDLELYGSNLKKMKQVLQVIEDTLQADKKKQQERALEKKSPVEKPAMETE